LCIIRDYYCSKRARDAHWRNYEGGSAYEAILGDVIKVRNFRGGFR
jgi:hypothetical protein